MDKRLIELLRTRDRPSHEAFVLPHVLNALQANAGALLNELRSAPSEAREMLSPEFAQRFAEALKKGGKIDPEQGAQMAMDLLQTTPVGLAGTVANSGKALADDMARALRRPVNHLGQEIPPTQYELAHAEAQRVAALPVEQGGLGLPPNNTAMDRAMAMGFDTDAYHGGADNIKEFDKNYSRSGQGVWFSRDPVGGPNGDDAFYPVRLNINDLYKYDPYGYKAKTLPSGGYELEDALIERAKKAGKQGYMDIHGEGGIAYFIGDTKNARSRFAAFNPANRDSSDLLAGLAAPLTTSALLAALLAKPDEAQAK